MFFRTALACLVVGSIGGLPLAAQFKPSSTCKFLSTEEAAAVIGAGAKLTQAIENGACTYKQGKLTLTIVQPFSYSDRKVVDMGYEASAKSPDAKPVSGLGDRAHLKKGNSGYQLMFQRGNLFGGLELYGEGADTPAMVEKLQQTAKKVIARM